MGDRKYKPYRPSAVCFRMFLFANLLALMIYGATTPGQMIKVLAERVTLGVCGFAMVVQPFVLVSVWCRCLPYNVWVVIGLDAISTAGWIAAIAMLSYWNINVVYKPRKGDPSEWLECAHAQYWDQVWTADGAGSWIHLEWCKVEVDGKSRLIGNDAARQQLHVLIGLSTVSLLFTGLSLLYTCKYRRERKWEP